MRKVRPMRSRSRKGERAQGQPVWILVAVLLAVMVAVTMYRLLQSSNAGDISKIQEGVSEGTAAAVFEQACLQWKGMSWGTMSKPARGDEQYAIELYAWRASRVLSKEEIEAGRMLGVCDCAVFLYQRKSIDYADMLQLWKEHKDCNSWATSIGCAGNYCGTGSAAGQCKKDHGCPGG